MNTDSQIILILGFVLFAFMITYIVVGFSNLRKITKQRNSKFISEYFIQALCDGAEKVFEGDGRGKEKLAWVLNLVEVECETSGEKFDLETVTSMIEKFVKEGIKKEVVAE